MTPKRSLRFLLLAAASTAAPAAWATFPAAPPGLTVATADGASSTPVSIPVVDQVVTSTITIAGAGTSIWDVDATTFIRHGANGELQVTLTSPAGTVVTLASAPFNDETDDFFLVDVFNGTLWDDQANPGGQVPYVLNPGNGNDHDYTTGVLAPRLTPTEALGAFRGENPNGTWTLSARDIFQVDGSPVQPGTIDRWSLAIATISPLPPFSTAAGSNATAQPLPATGTPTIASTIVIDGAVGRIYDLDVRTFVPHTNSADIDMTLRSPAGTVVTLTSDLGAVFDNVFNGTTWDDQANPGGSLPYPQVVNEAGGSNAGLADDHGFNYANNVVAQRLAPSEPLSAFNGESANGTWTLTVSDDRDVAPLGSGQLTSWSLDFDLVGGDGVVGGPPSTSVTSVPTLGWTGALALALALAFLGLARVRRARA
jgi:subtilisin-like proprotein convertase family protein